MRTRLWMGTLLVVLAVGVLVGDQWLVPWLGPVYPFLFVLVLSLALLSCAELLGLLGPERRLPSWLCYAGVAVVIVANWPAHLLHLLPFSVPEPVTHPWHWVLGAFVAVVLAAFLVEMATFREPGSSVTRIAVTIWVAVYLGLLPSFLAQLRWPPPHPGHGAHELATDPSYHGTLALALAVFVPKCGDIGAYMIGRFLGRHPMTPVLSPKKTWEGFAGGLVASVVLAVGLYSLDEALRPVLWAAVGFGLTVGVASVLGDLAESLIKRDCRQKDASRTLPGFGGVLDVIDSIVFAAPVAYCWLRFLRLPAPGNG